MHRLNLSVAATCSSADVFLEFLDDDLLTLQLYYTLPRQALYVLVITRVDRRRTCHIISISKVL